MRDSIVSCVFSTFYVKAFHVCLTGRVGWSICASNVSVAVNFDLGKKGLLMFLCNIDDYI